MFTEQKTINTKQIKKEIVKQIQYKDLFYFLKGIDDSRPILKRGFIDFKDEEIFTHLQELSSKNKKLMFVQELNEKIWTLSYDVELVEEYFDNKDDFEFKPYLIGSFFSSGSFIRSENRKWIEIRFRSASQAEKFIKSINKVILEISVKDEVIVCIRKRESIESFFAILDLNNYLFRIVEEGIENQLKKQNIGSENFILNNKVKSLESSQKQLDSISKVLKIKKLKANDLERKIWNMRIQNPELSISELNEKLESEGIKITRSTLYRKLNKPAKIIQKVNSDI